MIDLRGVTSARNRTLDLISLAEALLLAGEIDEAGGTAQRAAAGAQGVTSGRLDTRLTALHRQMRPHAGRSELVAEFLGATR